MIFCEKNFVDSKKIPPEGGKRELKLLNLFGVEDIDDAAE